uniref:Uncharacterized protein n=1 Tax=Arundo donax TaxID=35708 RepID=A0A0A9G6N7_ARUDO
MYGCALDAPTRQSKIGSRTGTSFLDTVSSMDSSPVRAQKERETGKGELVAEQGQSVSSASGGEEWSR